MGVSYLDTFRKFPSHPADPPGGGGPVSRRAGRARSSRAGGVAGSPEQRPGLPAAQKAVSGNSIIVLLPDMSVAKWAPLRGSRRSKKKRAVRTLAS